MQKNFFWKKDFLACKKQTLKMDKLFAFSKTYDARYTNFKASYVFVFFIFAFSMQICYFQWAWVGVIFCSFEKASCWWNGLCGGRVSDGRWASIFIIKLCVVSINANLSFLLVRIHACSLVFVLTCLQTTIRNEAKKTAEKI